MPRRNGTIEEQLLAARTALTNVLNDPQLQSALSVYGYSAERLGEGQALHERAHSLHQQQRIAYGNLTTAQEALRAAQARAKTDYMYYVKVARLVLAADRGVLKQLHLNGERKHTRSGWLGQALKTYREEQARTVLEQGDPR